MVNRYGDIVVFGHEVEMDALKQIQVCRHGGVAAALMGDHHVGYLQPIGGVVAYDDAISPAGVGFDIACGNKAVKLDIAFPEIAGDLPRLADEIWQTLSFGMGMKNDEKVEHELFEDPAWREVKPLTNPELQNKARAQLGTIGSGNHYVDVFRDEEDSIWIGVHFGSRGLGHTIASHYMAEAGGKESLNKMFGTPALLDAKSAAGEDYLEAMRIAGEYAYAGRDWVCERVARILQANVVDEVHNHHNFAWKEQHFGKELWVVRKGATPAHPGLRSFVGGSMGGISVILEGRETDLAKETMYSTVHGAGRVMSRTKAAGKMNYKTRQRSGGLVDWDSVRHTVANQGIELRGGGPDEAPEVYKSLPEVLEAHGDTIRIHHTLTPVIVCMAGSDEHDPYKD